MQWQEIKDSFWSSCPYAKGPAVNKRRSIKYSYNRAANLRPFLCNVAKISLKLFIIDSDGRRNIKSGSTWCPRDIIGHFPKSKMTSRWMQKITQIFQIVSFCFWVLNWWQTINSLRPSYSIWRHGSGSILAQVMACCLMAPSHYLNQCWLIICKVQ